MANIVIDGDGAVLGAVYASVDNQPQGHLEIRATSVEAVKLLINALGQWVMQHSTAVVVPDRVQQRRVLRS